MSFEQRFNAINLRIDKIKRQLGYKQIQRGHGAPTDPATCCFIFYIDEDSGTLYYKDIDGNWQPAGGSGSAVTSVGLALPSEFTVTNSPVTSTGTLTGTWAAQTTNKVFASPNGSTGTPSFRALVLADLPSITVPLSSLTNAVTGNTLANGTNSQTWGWSGILGAANAFNISLADVIGNGDSTVFNIASTGNSGSSSTKNNYGIRSVISKTKTSANSNNIAGYFSSTNGDVNYAAIFDQGNIGMGTTTPTSKLDVVGNQTITNSQPIFNVVNTNAASFGTVRQTRPGGDTFDWGVNGLGSGAGDAYFFTASNAMPINFYTNSVNRLSITPGGNIGINQTNPLSQLEVTNEIKISAPVAGVANFKFGSNPSTYGGISYSDISGNMTFYTTAYNVLISGNSGANEGIRVKNTGSVQMAQYGAGSAIFDASGNITSVSDERLKDIQHYYTKGLEYIKNINPIVFKWKEESGMETAHEYAGFSAQNIKEALGEEASGINEKGYLSIQDRAIIAALCNSVKELKAEIEELKSKLK